MKAFLFECCVLCLMISSLTGVLSLVELDDSSFEKAVTYSTSDDANNLWIIDFYAVSR